MLALVTGAGGFIGHHLVKSLVARGYNVLGADIKRPEYELSPAKYFFECDLRFPGVCDDVVRGVDYVYHLAADMGGIGYITSNHAEVAHNNVLIDANMLEAASKVKDLRSFFYSSSACVYPMSLQKSVDVEAGLRETDAYPGDPEPGYGWEKLFAEELCKYYLRDYAVPVRIARFHNVYGSLGTYDGGREKAPAALCRKVATASDPGVIDVWGDGQQTRSFLHVSDCIEGIYRLSQSNWTEPVNLGSDRMVTVNELAQMVIKASGKQVAINHDLTKPQGVRGRNSDNTRMSKILGWTPQITLERGLAETYAWVKERVIHERA